MFTLAYLIWKLAKMKWKQWRYPKEDSRCIGLR